MQASKRETIGIPATPDELRWAKRAAAEHSGGIVAHLLRKRSLRWVLNEGKRLERADSGREAAA